MIFGKFHSSIDLFARWYVCDNFHFCAYYLDLPSVVLLDGNDIGFRIAVMAVYGVCIFVTNFELTLRFNMDIQQDSIIDLIQAL